MNRKVSRFFGLGFILWSLFAIPLTAQCPQDLNCNAIVNSLRVGTMNLDGAVTIANNGNQWGGYNWGTNLIIKSGGAAPRNPAIGIFNHSNENGWAIANAESDFYIAQMPPLGDASSPPVPRLSIYRNGNVVIPTGNVGIGRENPTARLHVEGSFTATGPKCALVATASYGKRQLYAMESPENWFEDIGSAKLADGRAVIKLDPIFTETVSTNNEYHVFLTPNGDCLLSISDKTQDSFKVKQLFGSDRNCKLDYRIVAKRKGYEGVRLAEVNDPKGIQTTETKVAQASK